MNKPERELNNSMLGVTKDLHPLCMKDAGHLLIWNIQAFSPETVKYSSLFNLHNPSKQTGETYS